MRHLRTESTKRRGKEIFPTWKHFVEPPRSPLGCELAGRDVDSTFWSTYSWKQSCLSSFQALRTPASDRSTPRVVTSAKKGERGCERCTLYNLFVFFSLGLDNLFVTKEHPMLNTGREIQELPYKRRSVTFCWGYK